MADESPSPGKQVARRLTVAVDREAPGSPQKAEVQFWLYLPTEYDPCGKPVPLLLFLHGAGERGDDLGRVKIHGPPKLIATGEHFPFLVISPQQPWTEEDWDKDRWSPEILTALVDLVVRQHHVDKQRLYVTGLSMGGYGTWDLVTVNPSRFAAAAPICGGGDVEKAANIKDLPVWAFHGDADEAVPVENSECMVDAVNAAGGKAKLTIYPGVGHDSWTRTYENPALYAWLLSHTRRANDECRNQNEE